jgi:hypothetical protein
VNQNPALSVPTIAHLPIAVYRRSDQDDANSSLFRKEIRRRDKALALVADLDVPEPRLLFASARQPNKFDTAAFETLANMRRISPATAWMRHHKSGELCVCCLRGICGLPAELEREIGAPILVAHD